MKRSVVASFFEEAAIARERYLSFFREVIGTLGPNPALEVLVQPNSRSTPRPFCLCRMDVIVGGAANPRVQRIADQLVAGPGLSGTLDGLELVQESFSWEALRLTFEAPGFDVASLGPWLHRWLDVDEAKVADSFGLSGVVHDLSWDSLGSDRWQLNIDLGSAPLMALEELLAALRGGGVRSVTVSRHDAAETPKADPKK